MDDRLGPKQRLLAWFEHKAPPVHTFLTKDEPIYHVGRTAASIAVFALLAFALLWGGTGQPIGEAPVVVIETGSMMHCAQGVQIPSKICESTSFGRIGSIDPGDLVFVRDTDKQSDVDTFAEGGKTHHGKPGDVVVYRPGGRTDVTPIIHRAMFWVETHGDGTFSVPELGLDHVSNQNDPAINDPARFGLQGFCTLNFNVNGPSGWITKGDNNPCWDQTGSHGVSPGPVEPDWLLGKARGEVPWVGLLKLFVFDALSGTNNYSNAPSDLRSFMWVTVIAIVVVPYGTEKAIEYARRRKTDGEE